MKRGYAQIAKTKEEKPPVNICVDLWQKKVISKPQMKRGYAQIAKTKEEKPSVNICLPGVAQRAETGVDLWKKSN